MFAMIQEAFAEVLKTTWGWQGLPASLKLQSVPKGKQGDYALCVQPLLTSMTAPESAPTIALRLAEFLQVRYPHLVQEVAADRVFVNLTLTNRILFETAYQSATQELVLPPSLREKIGVEYLSPNTNKPLHLGHVRNGVLGVALINLFREVGHSVLALKLINDRGVHIMQSMLAYSMFGNGVTPESTQKKGDHLVGEFYVLFNQKVKAEREKRGIKEKGKTAWERGALRLLKRWEEGSPPVHALWKLMNGWVYAGFAVTLKRYGFLFDQVRYESKLYTAGKQLAEDGLRANVLTRDQKGAIICRLPPELFGLNEKKEERVAELLREDGTTLYLTQDLQTAVDTITTNDLSRLFYVVAVEQNDHFKTLFYVLGQLGFPWANHLVHYSYEMVNLPGGRMKSREGNVVDADDLLSGMKDSALLILRSRKTDVVGDEELSRRAEIVALAAIKFYFLKVGKLTKVTFDPINAIDFEGDTGSYCLYAYARMKSVLRKAAREGHFLGGLEETPHRLFVDPSERLFARVLAEFPSVVLQAAREQNTSLLAHATLEIAKRFNRFYHEVRVLDETDLLATRGRLALAYFGSETLRRGLRILGIEVLEEM